MKYIGMLNVDIKIWIANKNTFYEKKKIYKYSMGD